MSYRDYINEIWDSVPTRVINLERDLYKYYLDKGINQHKIMRKLDSDLKHIEKILIKKIDNCVKREVIPNYDFVRPSTKILKGCFLTEREETRYLLLYRNQIRKVINELDWRGFEKFSCYILKLYRFEKYAVGKGTKDGGLDFFGYKPHSTGLKYGGLLNSLNTRIFGQSKHYDSNVGEPEVHKFFSQYWGFERSQDRAFEYVSQHETWFIEIEGPISAVMMTNRFFSDNAQSLAKRRGIILRDGEQLVEDLIHLHDKEPWLKINDDYTVEFEKDNLASYIQNL